MACRFALACLPAALALRLSEDGQKTRKIGDKLWREVPGNAQNVVLQVEEPRAWSAILNFSNSICATRWTQFEFTVVQLSIIVDANKTRFQWGDQEDIGNPPAPFDDKHTRNDTEVVVLIAALRETRLAQTIYDMYTKAANPSRIFFGVVQQNAPDDQDILQSVCQKFGKPVVAALV